MKILFAIPFLPREIVSVQKFKNGLESLSGSQGSFLLVADLLAMRGHSVGIWVASGNRVTDTAANSYPDLSSALSHSWDQIVLASWEDEATFVKLKSAGIKPLLWTQVHVPRSTLLQLESEDISGIITVSDAARLSLLHSNDARRIGRVYNPLNPFFSSDPAIIGDRYNSKTVVFCGFLGETKGAHLVLKMWPTLKALVPEAKLLMAGSGKLYKTGVTTGPLGLADPEFERKYLAPITEKYGSLEESGISFLGLMNPNELRETYNRSSLGFINFNWHTFTETFCCVGAEMLATELPIFSYAASALPETMGRTGGAVLHNSPDLEEGAHVVAGLLNSPSRLAQLGKTGREFVISNYSLEKICSCWEEILADKLQNISLHAQPWNYTRGLRYWIENCARRLKLGNQYRQLLDLVK